MNMNDDIEKINEDYQNFQESKNQSDIKPGLDLSSPSVDERVKEKAEKLKNLSAALGIDQQREEIDKLNQSVTYIADKLNETNQAVNSIAQMMQSPGITPAPQEGQGMDIQKIEALGQIAEKAASIWQTFKGPQTQGQPALIDQSFINQKMVETFMDNLETGESINNFIKNSLKKSVTKNVINTSLKDIGSQTNQIDHSPA